MGFLILHKTENINAHHKLPEPNVLLCNIKNKKIEFEVNLIYSNINVSKSLLLSNCNCISSKQSLI